MHLPECTPLLPLLSVFPVVTAETSQLHKQTANHLHVLHKCRLPSLLLLVQEYSQNHSVTAYARPASEFPFWSSYSTSHPPVWSWSTEVLFCFPFWTVYHRNIRPAQHTWFSLYHIFLIPVYIWISSFPPWIKAQGSVPRACYLLWGRRQYWSSVQQSFPHVYRSWSTMLSKFCFCCRWQHFCFCAAPFLLPSPLVRPQHFIPSLQKAAPWEERWSTLSCYHSHLCQVLWSIS